jgi:hypothetical protein
MCSDVATAQIRCKGRGFEMSYCLKMRQSYQGVFYLEFLCTVALPIFKKSAAF